MASPYRGQCAAPDGLVHAIAILGGRAMRTLTYFTATFLMLPGVAWAGSANRSTGADSQFERDGKRTSAEVIDLSEMFASPLPRKRGMTRMTEVARPKASATVVASSLQSGSSLWRCHRQSTSRRELEKCLSDKRVSSLPKREASMPPAMEIPEEGFGKRQSAKVRKATPAQGRAPVEK